MADTPSRNPDPPEHPADATLRSYLAGEAGEAADPAAKDAADDAAQHLEIGCEVCV